MWRRAKASILTALTLQLGLSTGFGPTAWTVPRRGCGVESLHRGGGGLGSGERRSWDRVCDRGRLHDAIAAGVFMSRDTIIEGVMHACVTYTLKYVYMI